MDTSVLGNNSFEISCGKEMSSNAAGNYLNL